MGEEFEHRKKSGFANRIFKAVGDAGSAVGGVAGGLLRSAGQKAKNAGGRAALTFAKEISETPEKELRALAESFSQWLLKEHQGKAELQKQKPSTLELTQMGKVTCFFEIWLEEPGLMGRRFRFLFRRKPLSDFEANFPDTEETFHERALFVLEWPQTLTTIPKDAGVLVWDHAALVGQRNPAIDLLQSWLSDEVGGTFAYRKLTSSNFKSKASKVPVFGREEELSKAQSVLLTPRPRALGNKTLISLAAPGGTGKSYFLKALKSRVGHRVVWSGIDHQGIEKEETGLGLLGHLLAKLAHGFEDQSVSMDRFRKELRQFQKRVSQQEEGENQSGFFGHLRKAAEAAAGINPILGVANAGVVFLASWGQEAKEESEALAKDDAVRALTKAFKDDLRAYCRARREKEICWERPVLVFDTYEWLAPLIDTWVRTEFLPEEFLEESGVAVVLSGREHLFKTDTRWSEWQHNIMNITLKPFSLETAREYLESLHVPEERVEELHEFTEGLPLFLSLAAHIEEQDQAVGILAERVLEEVEEQHREDFLRAALLPNFDANNLKKLYPEREAEELEQLLELLNRATFTIASGGTRHFMGPVERIFRRALNLRIGEPEVARLKKLLG